MSSDGVAGEKDDNDDEDVVTRSSPSHRPKKPSLRASAAVKSEARRKSEPGVGAGPVRKAPVGRPCGKRRDDSLMEVDEATEDCKQRTPVQAQAKRDGTLNGVARQSHTSNRGRDGAGEMAAVRPNEFG